MKSNSFGRNSLFSFCNRLKRFREMAPTEREVVGLTQKEVAEKLGVDYSTYRNWEKGRNRPLPVHRRQLAKLFPEL